MLPIGISRMPENFTPRQNHLLAALKIDDYEQLLPHLELVSLPLGQSLCEAGIPMHHVYFPVTAIVSLLNMLKDGTTTEIAGVGREGIVGVSLFMGGTMTNSQAVVQSAGQGYRLPRNDLERALNRHGDLLNLLLRYTQALLTQMAQIAVCNRHHSLDQRLCRWLLGSLDRLSSNNLIITQDLIANILGVRREGVTEAAGNLQKTGLIEYYRGNINVLDRIGLEARACECYAVVRKEFRRLLPATNSEWEISAKPTRQRGPCPAPTPKSRPNGRPPLSEFRI
jgi:CRP-like cAMP-binding protein